MNTRTMLARLGALAATVALMSACSSGMNNEPAPAGGEDEPAAEQEQPAPEDTTESASDGASDGDGMTEDEGMPEDPAANLVGAGCAEYTEMVPVGAGSVEGMALDPVSVAASNNPILTTLTAAVSGELNPDVDLATTLDGDEFTVFAPVDDAFAAVPKEDLNALVEDADGFSSVLTYHVVPGQIAPEDLPGTHTTVQGEDVEVSGSEDELMVDGATVVCGGVQTQNATVYLIDAVLMPPSLAEQS